MQTDRVTCHHTASALGSKNASMMEAGDAPMTRLVVYSTLEIPTPDSQLPKYPEPATSSPLGVGNCDLGIDHDPAVVWRPRVPRSRATMSFTSRHCFVRDGLPPTS